MNGFQLQRHSSTLVYLTRGKTIKYKQKIYHFFMLKIVKVSFAFFFVQTI